MIILICNNDINDNIINNINTILLCVNNEIINEA